MYIFYIEKVMRKWILTMEKLQKIKEIFAKMTGLWLDKYNQGTKDYKRKDKYNPWTKDYKRKD